MEPMITSFGISLAAGIVIEVFKSCFPQKVDKQIEDAFEEALNKCVKNDEFTKRTYKLEIKRKIRDNYSHNPNANLRDETVTGLHSKFFIEFEIALIKKEPAYAYIKEVRDDSRFQELKYGQEDLKQGVNEIKEQLANLISQSNKSDSLKSEYLRQLSQYQTNLEELNPTVALNNIIALEESFDKNSFTPEDSFKSKIELLKAKCYSLINGKKDETLECYIKAYNLNKSSNEAKELAAYAYYEKENVQKTDSLIKEILLIDDDNPIAWALQIVLADSDSLSELLVETPSYIINNNIFKRFLFICSIKCNKFKDLQQFSNKLYSLR